MDIEIKIFKANQTLADPMAEDLINSIRDKTSSAKAFNIGLAGGSTPKTIYQYWARIQDRSLWSKVHFFWGDERCVSPDDEESNYKMAYESFLSKAEIGENQIHRIHGEANPEAEVLRYANEIKAHLPITNNFPQFDWILLGIGTDGHTASLFPNSEALKEQSSICILARHPQTGQRRISLTLPVINNARKVTFLVTGHEKAKILHDILKNKPADYPAAQVIPQHGVLQWYLDKAAASLL